MERRETVARAARFLIFSIVLVGGYLLLKYALIALLPFIVAVMISLPICSLARRCETRLGGSRKAWSIFYFAVGWSAFLILLIFGLKRLLGEIGELIEWFELHSEEIAEWIKNTINSITALPSKLPFIQKISDSVFGDIGSKISEVTASILKNVFSAMSEGTASIARKIALATPRAFVAFVITIVSSFYLSTDREKICEHLLNVLPEKSAEAVKKTVRQVSQRLCSYAKAYLKLFFVTFAELYLGFLILGRRYAFILALSIALLDVLPLFGAGLALAPWGIVLIANGSVASGVGILILLCVVSIVRQVIESRIVGKELGIHPFISLAAMYLGFSAFGVLGMLIAPVATSCIFDARGTKRA